MVKKCIMRGVVGKDLNEKEIKQFAKKVVNYIYENNYKKSIIVAKDNRVTGDYILNLLCGVLLSKGIEVNVVGVATTPELAWLTKRFKFDLGIMITASHNPSEYNGFKCFNSLGAMIELDDCKLKNFRRVEYAKEIDFSKFKELYLRDLKNQLNTSKIKCVFDCANGAGVDVVRKVFGKSKIIGADTSGKYVNKDCGSEHLDNIKAVCKRNKKIGFAFDGDADRVVAIDEFGNVVDGDKILYILATQLLGFGDKIVGTIVSSLGLEISLRRLGVTLVRERVGANYVNNRRVKENSMLAGEGCGHIFLNSNISDGVRVAIELINILNRTGLSFNQLLSGYKNTYKLTKDIDLSKVDEIAESEQVCKTMRVIVRKGETEPKLRIYIEGIDKVLVENKFEQLLQQFN